MKKALYGLVVLLLFSVVQFNVSDTFADKIGYKKIFTNNCQKCHGKDGNGTKRGKGLGVPNFTDGEWQDATTDKQMITAITNGKKKKMNKEGDKKRKNRKKRNKVKMKKKENK
jgi:mono/diheme cytochrome c family protein